MNDSVPSRLTCDLFWGWT